MNSSSARFALKVVLRQNTSRATPHVMKSCFSTGGSLHWAHYPMGPPDPIVGLNEAYAKDVSNALLAKRMSVKNG